MYARSFGGRVARLQALFAGAAREADRYTRLDEREIAADLVPWLMERPKLSRDQAELTVEGLRRRWKGGGPWAPDPLPATPTSEEPPTQAADPEGSSQASASEPEEPVCKQARVLDRQANYVIVELSLDFIRLGLAVAGWAAAGPSATVEILSLGPRPTSIPTCAGYAGPTAPRLRKTTPRKGR